MHNNESYEAIYQASSLKQKYFYASSESGTKLVDISKKYNLAETSSYQNFALIIGDVILGVKTFQTASTEFVTVLKLDLATAAALANDVGQFLAPLNDPNWQPPADFLAEIAEEETAVITPAPNTSSFIPTQAPATAAAASLASVTGSLPQVRTMAGDGGGMAPSAPYPTTPTPQIDYDNTPTYQSSQEQVFGNPPQT